METQDNILSDNLLVTNADPLLLSNDLIYLDLLSGAIAPAPLSQETDLQGDDKSKSKDLSDEKLVKPDDKLQSKDLSDEKLVKPDDKFQSKDLSDEKSLKNVEYSTLSEGMESLIVQPNLTDTNLGLSDTIQTQETDIDFSTLLGEAPTPQTPDTGNDTIIGDFPSFLVGDDNPNNLSAVGSFVKTYIWGLGGDDILNGGWESDILNGGTGDDLLNGGFGNDWLNGGSGNDVLYGSYGNDTLDGGDGTDTVTYSASGGTNIKANLQTGVVSFSHLFGVNTHRLMSVENVVGSIGNDEIIGDSADNVLSGENGNDFLSGEDGNDVLFGGNGDDTLNGGNGFNQLNGGDGYDIAQIVGEGDILFNWGRPFDVYQENVVEYGNNNAYFSNIEQVQIIAGNNDDFVLALDASVAIEVEGKGGNDVILAGIFNDTLLGGAGNDLIRANNGNDIIQGSDNSNSVEKDTLLGESGADTFVLATSNGSLYLGDGFATILDFKWWEGDTIKVAGSISDYRLDMTKNFSGNPALDTAIYRGNDLIAVVQDTTDVIPAYDFRFA